MGKRLTVLLALALIVGLTFSAAYAEVQNVKVSGDIIASGVARNHFNLSNSNSGDKSVLKQNFLMTQVRLRVDADLTDNVMATVRLINERIWNGQNDHGVSGLNTDTNNNSIDLDLAYVTLKEFLYSPLTLTIGRQEIKFGNSFIIGNAKVRASGSSIPTDLTERKAFDAIRATLNYDPLVVDLVYAQVKQDNSVDRNTISLTGINATYALNNKTDVSVYYWLKKDNNTNQNTVPTSSRPDQLSTIGALISLTPIDNMTTSLEAAYQFGRNTSMPNAKKHDAWALQAMADYTFAKVKTTPKIGASYTYLSGANTGGTRNQGWDPLFYDQKLNNIVYTLLPFSNMNAFNLKGSLKPVEDVTVSLVYGYYNVAQKRSASFTVPNTYDNGATYYGGGTGTYTGKTHLGNALDGTVTYDYTEDVQFALTGGYFLPGNALTDDTATATQLIGSMKVVF
ncbi:MAG: alginate export family protein [Candidatus Omnitrophica bacterium]|nr:alginate export family protein [Candidatus Omnitrophota bacterium]